MCNLSQSVEDGGVEKGVEKGVKIGVEIGAERQALRSLQTLMKNMNLPVEKALTVLEVPQTDWQKYRKLLTKE